MTQPLFVPPSDHDWRVVSSPKKVCALIRSGSASTLSAVEAVSLPIVIPSVRELHVEVASQATVLLIEYNSMLALLKEGSVTLNVNVAEVMVEPEGIGPPLSLKISSKRIRPCFSFTPPSALILLSSS